MRLAIVTFSVVFATAIPAWGQAADPTPSPSKTAGASSPLSAMPSTSQVVVEVLKGSQARDYLARVEKDHPGRFKGVGDALREHGAHPTNKVFVARTRRFQVPSSQATTSSSCLPSSNGLQSRSDSFSDADGEVIFTSWNDGNDGTWEGTIYSEDYSTGNWQTWEGQADIETANYYGIWGNIDATGGPGGGGPLPKSEIGLVTKGDWGDYFSCLAVGAYNCGNACIYSGELWPECFGACGAVYAIGCAIHVWYY